jgi:hypothetical protein
MSEAFVLGVDGGASKTECALLHLPGGARHVARGAGSNHESVGYEQAARVVGDLFRDVMRLAGIAPGDIAGACFAMAGMDVAPDRDNIRRHIVAPLRLACPLHICNDAFAGFRAGSPRGIGICVSLGSGTTFCGRNEAGATLQFEYPLPLNLDGRIANALLAEYQGIGPQCGFTADYLRLLGVASLEEYYLARYAAKRDFGRPLEEARVREARRALFTPAMRAEPATVRLLRGYADDLAEILVGMGRRLSLGEAPFDLVLSGSLLTKGRHPALNGRLAERVRQALPGARPVTVEGLPVEGALLLARELAQGVGRGVNPETNK